MSEQEGDAQPQSRPVCELADHVHSDDAVAAGGKKIFVRRYVGAPEKLIN
jgi:hypothetical protein